MKKYFSVAVILFKAQMIYRFDVVLTAVGTVWRVLFAWILWGAVYAGRETVGGFTFQAMLSYYVVSSFLTSANLSSGVSGEVSYRIRGGSFTKFMVIPSDPQLHFLSMNFGASIYYSMFSIVAAVICVFLFRVQVAVAPDFASVLIALVMVPFGLTFMVCYHFFIGTLAFKFQDIGFFLHVQESIIAFLTGAIIPLTLLPDAALIFLRYVPFTYVTYIPAMLLTGRVSANEGMIGLAVLSAWAVFMMIVSKQIYERLRVKFDGVGV